MTKAFSFLSMARIHQASEIQGRPHRWPNWSRLRSHGSFQDQSQQRSESHPSLRCAKCIYDYEYASPTQSASLDFRHQIVLCVLPGRQLLKSRCPNSTELLKMLTCPPH